LIYAGLEGGCLEAPSTPVQAPVGLGTPFEALGLRFTAAKAQEHDLDANC